MADHQCTPTVQAPVGQCSRADRPDDPPAVMVAWQCRCGAPVSRPGARGIDPRNVAAPTAGPGPGRPPGGFTPGSSNHRPPPPTFGPNAGRAATADDDDAAMHQAKVREAADDVAAMYQAKVREAAAEAVERRRSRYFR